MKIQRNCRALGAIALITLLAAIVISTANAAEGRERYIIVLKDSVDHPVALAHQQADDRNAPLSHIYSAVLNGYAAALTPQQAAALEHNPKVKYVEKDEPIELFAQTIPTGIERAFAPKNPAPDIDGVDDVRINADVAIIDTGVDFEHPDLNVFARTEPKATYSYVNCLSADPADELPENDDCKEEIVADGYGHGTHVAGTVGAIDNGVGAVGVAPGVRIWSAKIFNDNGGGGPAGVESSALAAFNWVYEHREQIEVVNMSFGGAKESQAWSEAISKAVNAGVVFVAAAGNDGADASNYAPAKFNDVITVSALADYDGLPGALAQQNCELTAKRGTDDTLALFSNWGAPVDVAAPGVCIYSTLPIKGSHFGKEYGKLSGTSMASPHVAGAAAILASTSNPNSKSAVEAIRQQIIDEGSFNWTDTSGDGVQEPLLDLRPSGPDVATMAASNLQASTAKLNGIVNPGGLETSYRFEYGPTTEYGKTVPASPKGVGVGIKDVKVSETIEVEPESVYHYRIVATNSSGTLYGSDRTTKTSKWAIQAAELPPVEHNAVKLSDLSCVAASDCVAVGNYAVGNENRTFAERLVGAQWVAELPINPSGAVNSELEDISCVSEFFCMAAGRYKTTFSGYAKPLVELWNGFEWTASTPPMPTPTGAGVIANGTLTSISCSSVNSCIAVGQYVNAQETPKLQVPIEELTLIESWDGSKWTILSSPNVAGKKGNNLSGVSCTSSTSCTAVGTTAPNPPSLGVWLSSSVMAQRWNGSSWTLQTVPDIPSSSRDSLEDVSCSSSISCMAVGNAYNSKGKEPGFTMSWNGSAWQLLSNGLEVPLKGVSCTSSQSCDAIGPNQATHWNGTSWISEGLLTPGQEPGEILGLVVDINGLFCSKGRCSAVGSYYAYGEGYVPLIERRDPAAIGFVTDEPASGTAYIQGSQPLTVNMATSGFGSIKCSGGPSFEATLTKPNPRSITSKTLGTAACTGGISSMTTNGCQLTLRPNAEEVAPGSFAGTFDIGPVGCGPIKLKGSGCEISIGAQNGFAATYRNEGSGKSAWVAIEAKATGIKYTSTLGCGPSGENGTLSGTWQMKNYENAAHTVQIGVQVATSHAVGLYIAGAEPKLQAEEYPVTISGKQTTSLKYGTSGGNLKCTGIQFSGEALGATAAQQLNAMHTGCTMNGQSSAVAMNSCRYQLNVANSGPPYTGTLALVCAEAGDTVEVSVGSPIVECTTTIPAQAIGAVTYGIVGTGINRHVVVTVSGSGIKYTGSGGTCASGENGTLSGAFELQGSKAF